MLRHAFATPQTKPLNCSECFARARVKLEGWMRGQPLDVEDLADDLSPLPDNVCYTLVRGLPKQLESAVMATVHARRGRLH